MTLLLLLALACQAPILFGWTTPVRVAGEAAVNATIVLPALADAAAVWQSGEWPAWNPYARLGEPFSVSGAQPLYPGYWPILFGGAAALPWVLVLHSALACVLMFRWLRALPATRFTAFLCAGSYGTGVFFQVQLLRLPEAAAAAWLPMALEGVWRLTRPGRRAAFVGVAAVGFAAMFVTGARAVPWLGALAAVLIGSLNLTRMPRADRGAIAAQLGAVAGFVVLLAAPIWLEAWQHHGTLVRGNAPPTTPLSAGTVAAATTSWPATQLALNGAGGKALELALFPGTIILLMLALAFLRPSPAQPRWPWFALAILGMLAACDGPWSLALHDHVGLDADRPGASLVLLQLGVLVLACLGLDGFLEAPFRRTGAILAIGAGAVALGLFGLGCAIARPAWVSTLLAASRAADDAALAAVADAFAVALAPTAAGLALLGAALLFWRRLGILRLKVAIATIAFVELLYLAFVTAPSRTTPATIDVLGADSGRVVATDADSLERLHRARAPARRVNRSGDALLARTHAFCAEAMPGMFLPGARVAGGAPHAGRFVPHLASLGQVDVLLGDAAFQAAMPAGPEGKLLPEVPWARMVFAARYFDSTNAARRALAERAVRADTVMLDADPSEFVPRAPNKPAQITVLVRTPHRARLQIDAGVGRGYLVLGDAHAPGWCATLDGEPVPLLAADVAFRALAIPEGRHEVEVWYEPWGLRYGLPSSLLGAVVCLMWCVLTRRRR